MKLLFTALFAVFALVAGLFVACVGLLSFIIRRLRGAPSAAAPAAERRASARPESGTLAARPFVNDSNDVIDVIATEVPVDRAGR